MTRTLLIVACISVGCAPSIHQLAVDITPAKPQLVPQVLPHRVRWTAVAASPSVALLGDENGAVRAWDLRQRALLRTFHAHSAEVVSIALLAEVAWSFGKDGSMCRIAMRRLEVDRCFKIEDREIDRAVTSPDGRRAIVLADFKGMKGGHVVSVDLETGRRVASKRVSEFEVWPDLMFVPGTQSFATCGVGARRVAIWDADSLRSRSLPIECKAMAVSKRGVVTFAMNGMRGTIELHDAQTGAQLDRISYGTNLVYKVAAAGDYAIVGGGAFLEVFRFGNQPGTASSIATHRGWFGTFISDDSAVLVTDRGLVVTDLTTGTEATIPFEQSELVTAAFTSERVVSFGTSRGLLRLDLSTGTVVTRVLGEVVDSISSDGNFATTYRNDGPLLRDDLSSIWTIRGTPRRLREVGKPLGTPGFACGLSSPGCKLFDGNDAVEDAATGSDAQRVLNESLLFGQVWALSADARRFARQLPERKRKESWRPIDDHGVEVINVTNGERVGEVRLERAPVSLALSRDGRRLAIGEGPGYRLPDDMGPRHRLHLIDVDTGNELATISLPHAALGTLAFLPDGSLLGGQTGCHVPPNDGWCDLFLIDPRQRKVVKTLRGHRDDVRELVVSPDGKYAVSIAADATARIWRLDTGASVVLVTSGGEWLLYDDNGAFDASRTGARLASAVHQDQAFSFEQLATYNNRPDTLVAAMGGRDDVVAYFRYRAERRLARLGLRDRPLTISTTSAPIVTLDKLEHHSDRSVIDIAATVKSATADLARYQIWVNQVPIYDGDGQALATRLARIDDRVELSAGTNRIEISAWTVDGVESLRATHTIEQTATREGEVYFVGLGVSAYAPPMEALGYAHKDAQDLASAFSGIPGAHVHQPIIDGHVTIDALAGIREFLERASANDTVVVFIAGHGVLSADAEEFLFVPQAFDPARARETAIPFGLFEALFVGLKARRRMLLIDACVSGERDAEVETTPAPGSGMRARASRTVAIRDRPAPTSTGVRLPREYMYDRDRLIFTEVGRRNGLLSIASSRWDELSYEHDRWRNGAFTMGLKGALFSASSDTDGDGRVSADELRRAVADHVARLTAGLQHPSLRTDNLDAGITFPVLRGY